MTNLIEQKGGISIIGTLILGFLIIIILSYFHISIRAVVESPEGQDNLHYVGGGTVSLWNKYFKGPVSYFWNDIFIPIFWQTFVSNMQRLRDGQSTDYQNSAPSVNFNGAQGQ